MRGSYVVKNPLAKPNMSINEGFFTIEGFQCISIACLTQLSHHSRLGSCVTDVDHNSYCSSFVDTVRGILFPVPK